jgi:hypothetical protein
VNDTTPMRLRDIPFRTFVRFGTWFGLSVGLLAGLVVFPISFTGYLDAGFRGCSFSLPIQGYQIGLSALCILPIYFALLFTIVSLIAYWPFRLITRALATKWKLLLAGYLLLIITTAGVIVLSERQNHNRAQFALKADLQPSVLNDLHTLYLIEGKLVTNWGSFAKAVGPPAITPERITLLYSMDYLGDRVYEGLRHYQKSAFPAACEQAAEFLEQWDSQRQTALAQWNKHNGNLKAQLELFLDPTFEVAVVANQLEALHDRYNVPEQLLTTLLQNISKLNEDPQTARAEINKIIAEILKTSTQ